jgi:nucleoside-diphosphate-sugar epimerase
VNSGSKKVIILGGFGFLGSAFSAEAMKRGWETVRIGRADYDKYAGATCEVLINANGNSKKYLAEKDPQLNFDLSVRSVAQSFRDFKAGLYVYISSIDVYADKFNPANNREDSAIDISALSCYGFHKFMAETIVRYHAAKWLILRMGGFVGPGLKKNSIYDLLKGRPLFVHPDSRYQYLETGDMAEIVFRIIESGRVNEIFNLTGEGTITVREIAGFIPGNKPVKAPANDKPEHYEMNISKIKKHVPVPETRKTVEYFVKEVLGGKIKLP